MYRDHTSSARPTPPRQSDLRAFFLGGFFLRLYSLKWFRGPIKRIVLRWEGGTMRSSTWRRILARYHDVIVGRFSYGPPIVDGSFPPGTRVGSFCSLAPGLQILRRNHPLSRPSQHPLFYNAGIGVLSRDSIPDVRSNPLVVGNDVWIGVNVIICPGCRAIGDGAIIAAGAVVTKDVPPCSIVGGNPARVIRKRFSDDLEGLVLASRWWEHPVPRILESLPLFLEDLTPERLPAFLLAFPPNENGSISTGA